MQRVARHLLIRRTLFAAPLMLAAGGCTVLSPTPATLDAGDLWITDQKNIGTVNWTNVSTGPVTATSPPPNSAGPGFVVAPLQSTATTLAPGASGAGAIIAFRPRRAGTYSDSTAALLTTSGWTEKVQPVTLTGRGIARLDQGALSLGGGYLVHVTPVPPGSAIAANGLDFGSVPVGQFAARTIRIENSGNQPIRANVRLVLNGPPAWTVSMTTAGPPIGTVNLPAGGATTVIVTFVPQRVEEHVDRMEISDPGNPTNFAGVVLRGRGVQPLENQ